MQSDPISKNEPFLHEKLRRKLEISPRAFSSSPNSIFFLIKFSNKFLVKVGATNILSTIKADIDDEIVVNQKFMEYDRTIDYQSGSVRKQKL